MSHLPAQDLLTAKLISRRFYSLVTSPIAWSNAFAKYFPGPDTLRLATSNTTADRHGDNFRTGARVFTRLSASVSWSSEYLARTRLLRALMRGRPSLPFAAPCPGKPGKGGATFTFSSRIWRGCSALDADFGSIFDKRKPQFVHGSALSGSVTSSDRRGKFDAWGLANPVFFRHFHEIYPGIEPFGMGAGTCVGVPNMMAVSHQYGMTYGEGTPGGNVHLLGAGEKHARILTGFVNVSDRSQGIPRLSNDVQCPTALWMARTTAMPRVTQGAIGIITGSSFGTVTAYSLGSSGAARYERGEMTARWILSPGVPIIAVCADDHATEDRVGAGRTWAFALNALGELFYIRGSPTPTPRSFNPGQASAEELAQDEERRAWRTGRSLSWRLVPPTLRVLKFKGIKDDETTSWFPAKIYDDGSEAMEVAQETLRLQPKFTSAPVDVRLDFQGWDMQRKLVVDFASDDGRLAGESAIIIRSGQDDTAASIVRLKRVKKISVNRNTDTRFAKDAAPTSAITDAKAASRSVSDAVGDQQGPTSEETPQQEDLWLRTCYLPGIYSLMHVTATATDDSVHAITTAGENEKLQLVRSTARHGRAPRPDVPSQASMSSKIPGTGARLFAVGNSAGSVFLWNMRAPTSKAADISNEIHPVRVIATDSPGVASIALSSLYLVHGGTEGLLQAWDLLASTTEPLRTLSSRRLVNNRRRAILAARQASVPPTWVAQLDTERLAASTICLDPDASVLRGVATIDSWIKYWSFSSASSAEELSRSQKRKLKKGTGSKNPGLAGGGEAEMSFSGNQRRGNLKGYVNHELQMREMEKADERRATKEDRRFAGRFGTELLGSGASEEDMLAYAKMLSHEETEKQTRRTVESAMKLGRDASSDEVEAHRAALSKRDAEKWKYASWRERFEMLPDGGVALPREFLETMGPRTTPTAEDLDVKQALELSLEEDRQYQASTSASDVSTLEEPGSSMQVDVTQFEDDPDLAEAIALSMSLEQNKSEPTPSRAALGRASPRSPHTYHEEHEEHEEEDDLAHATRMSLANRSSSSRSQVRQRTTSIDDGNFPSLASSSPPSGSVSAGRGKRSKGKATKGAW